MMDRAPDTDAPILTEQVRRFLKRNEHRVRPDTYKQYQLVLERIFLPWCESQGFEEARNIVDSVMYQFTDYLRSRERRLSHESVRSYLRPVQIFLKSEHVPRGDFRLPSPKDAFLEPLTREDVDAMVDVATSERDRLMIEVLWGTGLWLGELLALRTPDLKHKLEPRKTYLRVRSRGTPRDVPIEPSLFDRLKEFAESEDSEYIFMARERSGQGLPLTKNAAGRKIEELASRAGIRRESRGARCGVNALLFRQSYAIRWLEQRGSPIDLMKILGHTRLDMIAKLYARLAKSDPFDEMMRLHMSTPMSESLTFQAPRSKSPYA